jgi:tRNA threonylcarbamoyl adenosine modification protein YjeE
MTATRIQLDGVDEAALKALAGKLAPRLRAGDFLALRGDLGAGKTAFARYLIRALLEREDEEVPSPTFALVQPYAAPRFSVHHYDFYRLSGPDEAGELGIDEALAAGLVIAEWPERLEGQLPADRLEIALAENGDADRRAVTVSGEGAWAGRVGRFAAIDGFIQRTQWVTAGHRFLIGDASTRGYTRLHGDGTALLMDSPKAPDGPPIRGSRPYSRIAHLAEDVRPFVAVAEALRAAGLSTPKIYAADLDAGLLLLEDFGDLTFSRLATEGKDLLPLYRLAIDGLLTLRQHPPAHVLTATGVEHILPDFDLEALGIETELLLDWYMPAAKGVETSQTLREEFAALWAEQFNWLFSQPSGWVLRDYHSPNLLWRPEQSGLAQLGVIDFQDAMRGNIAYDLASLLQDARIDLPSGLEDTLFTYYCDHAATDPAFDRAAFTRAYRILGAQRATKLFGLFVRLCRRDGKRVYLQHLPRIARYFEANIADPDLAALKAWYDREVPRDIARIVAGI